MSVPLDKLPSFFSLKVSFISIHGDSEDGYASLDSFQVLEDDPERVCEIIPSLAEIIECEAGQFECPDDHSCINEVSEYGLYFKSFFF